MFKLYNIVCTQHIGALRTGQTAVWVGPFRTSYYQRRWSQNGSESVRLQPSLSHWYLNSAVDQPWPSSWSFTTASAVQSYQYPKRQNYATTHNNSALIKCTLCSQNTFPSNHETQSQTCYSRAIRLSSRSCLRPWANWKSRKFLCYIHDFEKW